ncbi:protein argonaute 4A-like [Lycium barbarum]|uniref:protein argonaute 4A-like n=1 Tax=Lycium barbarum TaxID=112863 RepID=UPI00293E0C85|nr:protein argonaute 4A-like [Lycium barbarum]
MRPILSLITKCETYCLYACQHLEHSNGWIPRFTVIIALKNHHAKFFLYNSVDNVAPGTVVNNTICHPTKNDFFMCAHAVPAGIAQPRHYEVYRDEIGYSTDEMQELVHSLSYVSQRSTTAISDVAPIRHAQLAAKQMSQLR